MNDVTRRPERELKIDSVSKGALHGRLNTNYNTQPQNRVGLEKFQSHILSTRFLILTTIDITLICMSYMVAFFWANVARYLTDVDYVSAAELTSSLNIFLVASLPLCYLVFACSVSGHYTRRISLMQEVSFIGKSLLVAASITTGILFALKLEFSRFWTVFYFIAIFLFIPLGRVLSRKFLTRAGLWRKPTTVIGDGPVGLARAEEFCKDKYLGLYVHNYIDISASRKVQSLAELLRDNKLDGSYTCDGVCEKPHVIVSIENMENLQNNRGGFDSIMNASSSMTFIPPISGVPLYNSNLVQRYRSDIAVFDLQNNLKKYSARLIKRVIDLVLGSFALLLLSPLLILLSVLVKLDGGPVFYSQIRLGNKCRKFSCYKLRSMRVDADEKLAELLASDEEAKISWDKDRKLKNDPRITSLGKFIRKSSVDEIPQLWNVVKGDMSLVGPRPIVESEVEKYESGFDYYREAKPGITGLWQVSGRNNTTYKERVSLDIWYVRNWSVWLDGVILLKTVPTLIFGKGAY